MKKLPLRRAMLICAALVVGAGPALAQTWPSKPVKMIVPAAPGSAPDVIARLLADRLGQLWGQTVIVDNRPGAGGIPGMSTLARSSNDGYTFGFVPAAMATLTPLLYKNPQFNVDTELQPVAIVGISPLMLVANASAPFSTLAELERYARAHTGKLNLAAPQMNSLPHLVAEMVNKAGGMGMTTVPYPSPPAAVTALIAGDATISADGPPGLMQHIKSGRLKPLAITSEKRLPGYENIPTVAETYPGFEVIGWFSIFVPAGFPAAQVDQLNRDVNKVTQIPEVVARFNELAVYPRQLTPAASCDF